jgi:hypothetical protein
MHTLLVDPRRSLIKDLLAIAALACMALLLITGFYRQSPSRSIPIDQASATDDSIALVQLQHFYGSEGQGINQRYRWSDGRGSIALPNPGGATIIRLRLAAGPTQPVPLAISTQQTHIDLRITPEFRYYTFIIPPQDTPRIALNLSSTARQLANDPRQLGVVLGNMAISGGGNPPSLLALLIALAIATSYAAMRARSLKRTFALPIASGLLIMLITLLATVGWPRPDIFLPILTLIIAIGSTSMALRGLAILAHLPSAWPAIIGSSLFTGLAVLPLIFYSITGTLTRSIADDYCYAVPARDLGPFGLVAMMYTTWSGRYTSTLLIGLLALVGPAITPILPTVLISIWLIGLCWALAEIGMLLGLQHPWISAVLIAAPTLTATLASAPNLFQSVYWQVGGQTYLAALIGAILLSAWILRSIRRKAAQTPTALFSLIAGIVAAGFSESNAFLNLSTLAIALIGVVLFIHSQQRRMIITILAAGLIGALIGLALVAIAPGNQVRQSLISTSLTPPMAVWSALQESIIVMRHSYDLIRSVPTAAWIRSPLEIGRPLALAGTTIAIVVIACGCTLVRKPTTQFTLRQVLGALLGIPFISAILAAANLMLGFYALGERPPERVFLASYFVIALGSAAWGCACGCAMPAQWRPWFPSLTLIATVALMAAIAGTAADNAERRPRMASYAAAWEQADLQARNAIAQHQHQIRVPAQARQLDGLLWITSDPQHWSNICTAQYYRLDQITSAEP